jgi:hypothetical protein
MFCHHVQRRDKRKFHKLRAIWKSLLRREAYAPAACTPIPWQWIHAKGDLQKELVFRTAARSLAIDLPI